MYTWKCIKSLWVQCVCLCMLELAVLGHWRHTCASFSLTCHPVLKSLFGTPTGWCQCFSCSVWDAGLIAKLEHPTPLLTSPSCSPQQHSSICPWKGKTPSPPAEDADRTKSPSPPLSSSLSLSLSHTHTHTHVILRSILLWTHAHNKIDLLLIHCRGCCVRAVILNSLTSLPLFSEILLHGIIRRSDDIKFSTALQRHAPYNKEKLSTGKTCHAKAWHT